MTPALRMALCASVALHLGAAVALYGPVRERQEQPPLTANLRTSTPPSAVSAKPASPADSDERAVAPSPKIPQPAQGQPRLAIAVPTEVSPPASSGAATLDAEPRSVSPLSAAPVATASAVPPAPPLELPRFDAAYLANPPPAYPRSARRRGIEGTTVVEARVSSAGEPQEVKLATSAGDAALDDAAMEAVRGWRFEPARRGSQAVQAWVRIPIVFRLN